LGAALTDGHIVARVALEIGLYSKGCIDVPPNLEAITGFKSKYVVLRLPEETHHFLELEPILLSVFSVLEKREKLSRILGLPKDGLLNKSMKVCRR